MRKINKMVCMILVFVFSLTSNIILTSLDVYAADKTIPAKTLNKTTANKVATYVAKVGNDEITKEEFNIYLLGAESMIQKSFGSSPIDWSTKIQDMTAAEFAKKIALDNLVSIKIFLNKAKAAKISLTKKEIDDVNTYIDNAVKNLGTTVAEQEKVLKQRTGVTIAQYKDISKNEALSQKFTNYRQSTYKYTDADLNEFYNSNIDEFYKVTVGNILFLTIDENNQPLPQDKQDLAMKNAEDTLEKVNLPDADFAALAKQYSEDPGSKDAGGEYTLTKNHQYVPEFENWATDPIRKVGDTGIIKTSFGYHVMKLE